MVSRGGDLEKYLCGSYYENPGDECVRSEIFESGVKTMRYGGSGIETDYHATESPAQYAEMVENMRDNGIEPVLQIPYDDGRFSTGTAAALVRYINIERGLNVRYWSIGNEPNQKYSFNNTAEKIATYFRQISVAIKAVDPTIIVTGPDLSFYDTSIMRPLTTPGGRDDITGWYVAPGQKKRYYVDILNFHTYPFDAVKLDDDVDGDGDVDEDDENVIAYTRDEVMAHPTAHSGQSDQPIRSKLITRSGRN